MKPGRPVWAALLGGAGWLAAPPATAQRAAATLDLGASSVHYDGFLPSSAGALAAALSLQGRTATWSARGSYLRFASGRSTWQGSLATSVFTPPLGRARPELWVTGGGSRYHTFPGFWHAVGGARVHFPIRRGTAWLDGSAGVTSFGAGGRRVAMLGTGLWARRSNATFTAGLAHTWVGDTSYADLQGTARVAQGAWELSGVGGVRFGGRGGGAGVFAEATLTLALGPWAALVLGGGRYPSDPARGTIPGRYASAAIRVRPLAAARRVPRAPPAVPVFTAGASNASLSAIAAWLQVEVEPDGVVRLAVHAPLAASVELAGDFTDWEPVPLRRTDAARWEWRGRLVPGVHRVNLRLDRGPWMVPEGAARVADDYGGEIGMIVVP